MSSYTTPKIEENPAREWVEYGRDNNYYQFLIDRFNGSAVNNAIITGIGEMIYGQGLDATDASRRPLDYAKMQLIFRDEDIRKVSLDLKLLGQSAFNVVWNKGKTEIKKALHLPIQNLRPEKAVDGEITGYYYSDDWEQYRKDKYKPIRYDCFNGKRQASESQVLVIHPYSPGFFYFSPVDYQGSLQWSEIDEEIGNYHLTNIQQGFAPSMMVNFNNGTPTKEEQDAIERKITQKFTSTSGKKFVLSFNDNQQQATTIDQIPISEAAEQYKFLSEECTKKILVGHRVTSPMLFGIKDKTGLGNNAEEIKVASQLFDNTVIKPKQNIILAAIDEVLEVNGIHLDVYFKTLQPIEFAEDIDGLTDETIEKETGMKIGEDDIQEVGTEVAVEEVEKVDASYNGAQISSAIDIVAKVQEGILSEAQAIVFLVQFLQLPEDVARGFFNSTPEQLMEKMSKKKDDRPFLDDYKSESLLEELKIYGEVNDEEEYELISEELVDTTNPDFHKEFEGFARDVRDSDAKAGEKSKWGDKGLYKVRYAYSKTTTKEAKNPSRPFCTEMIMMANSGIEFRYEDIKKMGRAGVNGEFAPKGRKTYDLFTWKGGVYCYHGWMRRIYFRKQVKGKFLPNKGLDNEKRVGNNPYVKQKGTEAVAPITTPNRGSLKNR